MPRQLVRPAEAFGAAWKLASVRLFSRMRSDVACLVFEPVEGSVAQRAFVRPRKILFIVHACLRNTNHRGDEADGGCHGWTRRRGARCRRDEAWRSAGDVGEVNRLEKSAADDEREGGWSIFSGNS